MWVIPEMRGSCSLCGYNRRLTKPNTGNCEHTTELHHCVRHTSHTHTSTHTNTHHMFSFTKLMQRWRWQWKRSESFERRKDFLWATDFSGMWRDDYEEIFHFDGSPLSSLSGMSVFTSGSDNPTPSPYRCLINLPPSSLLTFICHILCSKSMWSSFGKQ